MVEKKFIAIVLVCVALSVAVVGTVMMLTQKDSELQSKTEQIIELENQKIALEAQVASLQTETTTLSTEKAALETQVTSLQTEATSLNNEKDALETQVSILQTQANTLGNQMALLENENTALETQVSVLQSEKAILETQVTTLQSEVTTLGNSLTAVEAQVGILQTEVADLEDEVTQSYNLGYSEGASDGYQLGYDEGYSQGIDYLTEYGWYSRDPTYAEAIAFINSDTTDQHLYVEGSYVCYDFTADFNYNALQEGYRCGFVYIEFSDAAHAITCFNTTDRGLIYIEPQTDEIVTVAVGQQYEGYTINDMGIIW